nr:Crp/Fnr family transcriptional regulator [Chitinophaga chungangae]
MWKLSPDELSAFLYDNMFSYFRRIYPLCREVEDEILGHSVVVKFKKGDIILKHGQVCRYCYFAGHGLARAYYTSESGKDVSSWFMKEGDIIIAVQSFFEQMPSRETIEAVEDLVCIGLKHGALQEIYQKFPEFNFIGRILTQKYYIQMEERAFMLRMDNSDEKYRKFEAYHPEILTRVQIKDIASYLGIAPATLSRIRNRRRMIS